MYPSKMYSTKNSHQIFDLNDQSECAATDRPQLHCTLKQFRARPTPSSLLQFNVLTLCACKYKHQFIISEVLTVEIESLG